MGRAGRSERTGREKTLGGKSGNRKSRKSTIVYGGIAVWIVLFNLCAWNSTTFCDWYISHIFPIWVNTYGRVTGLFSFSVGEWMILAGLILVAIAVILAAFWMVAGCVSIIGKGPNGGQRARDIERSERKGREEGVERAYWKFRRIARGYYRGFAWILLGVCLVMSLNCLVLYHASPLSRQYFQGDDGEYTLRELIQVYNIVADQCNQLAGQMERDEEGNVVYTGSRSSDGRLLDMQDMAREAMGELGQEYTRLGGYYPRPKAMFFSDFMCQQYMQGYYFPFSMEANYNDVMHILNKPSTMCHELAHLRGYIYEDEANFIGFLACVKTEDPFFQYAGYLSVLNYLYNDLYKASQMSQTAYEQAIMAVPPVTVSEQVWADNIFVSEEEWERINGKALIDTEVVDKAADVFIDTNLKVNGVADGKTSYSRVVRLLIQYYRNKED